MKIPPNTTLLMIGDSITDCDRAQPIGENCELGNGYVSLIHAILGGTCPERGVRILNMGIGGNTVRDLEARWQTDVLDLNPDWLSIMIGINDVWQQLEAPIQTDWQAGLEEYATGLERLVRTIRPQLKGLVLMTPFLIESNRADPIRAAVDKYGEAVGQLAVRYQAILVDTQAAFDAALTVAKPMTLTSDRVHPNLTGHMIIARAFLKALDFAW